MNQAMFINDAINELENCACGLFEARFCGDDIVSGRCMLWELALALGCCRYECAPALLLEFAANQRRDGCLPEWLDSNGVAGGYPGDDGCNEVYLDTSTAFVDAAWHVARWYPENTAFVEQIIPHLGLALQFVPRSRTSGLVSGDNGNGDKKTFISDHWPVAHKVVCDDLFSSLLFIRACSRLADLLRFVGSDGEADLWLDIGDCMGKRVRMQCWDKKNKLFKSYSKPNAPPDLWGSALSVCMKTATSGQLMTISRMFGEKQDVLSSGGFVKRHHFSRCSNLIDCKMDECFFGAAAGCMAFALDFFDNDLTNTFVNSLVQTVVENDAPAFLNSDGMPCQPRSLPTVCNIIEGLRHLRERRSR